MSLHRPAHVVMSVALVLTACTDVASTTEPDRLATSGTAAMGTTTTESTQTTVVGSTSTEPQSEGPHQPPQVRPHRRRSSMPLWPKKESTGSQYSIYLIPA